MKNAKKILERKRKIIVVLVVMVSFVSVLAWYQMKKAHAYQSYNTGGNVTPFVGVWIEITESMTKRRKA